MYCRINEPHCVCMYVYIYIRFPFLGILLLYTPPMILAANFHNIFWRHIQKYISKSGRPVRPHVETESAWFYVALMYLTNKTAANSWSNRLIIKNWWLHLQLKQSSTIHGLADVHFAPWAWKLQSWWYYYGCKLKLHGTSYMWMCTFVPFSIYLYLSLSSSIHLFIHPSIHLSFCRPACMVVCLSVYLSLYLSS